jgi:hypothetical protein
MSKTRFVVEVEFEHTDPQAAMAATEQLITWFLEHVGEGPVEMVETTCESPTIVPDTGPRPVR